MGKKISELDLDTTPDLTAEIETERSGASFRMSLQDVVDLINAASGGDPYNGLNARGDSSYTLVLSDAGKEINFNISSSRALTVPSNASVAFPLGTRIYVTMTAGVGNTFTIQGSGGVTVRGSGTVTGRFGGVLWKVGTDTWLVI